MAFVEDRQLIELSLSPRKSLFPVLNRAEAMSPLIVLLALLPPLYVLVNRTLTPLDAMWGLKAVAISTSDSALTWIDPATAGAGGKDIPLKWQPPLSSWLIAGVMSLSETHRPLALVLFSFLATAGLIVVVFGLAERLRGPIFAWWTTCLVALHGPILQGAQTPAPVSLTLFFAVAACWGFVTHCQDSKRLLSWPLAWGGLSWGLCLLAGGPVALLMVAILLLYVLSRSQESKSPKKTNGSKPLQKGKARPALQSLGLLLLMGFAIGGWWELWLFFRHGFEFLAGWFAGASQVPDAAAKNIGFAHQLLRDISQMGGALIGLTILGIATAVWRLRLPAAKSERSSLALMLAWAGCAGIAWLSLRAGPHSSSAFSVVWRGFCLIPATMLAAFAIEQIGKRQIGYYGVLLGLCLSLGTLLLVPVEVGFGFVAVNQPLWPSLLPMLRDISNPDTHWLVALLWRVSLLLCLGLLACWGLWRTLKNSDFRQRAFLGLSLGFFLVLHGVVGFLGIRQATLNDRALANVRNELIQEPKVARWTLVSSRRAPLTLRFLLTSIWPRSESLELDSWWDPEFTRDIAQARGSDGLHIVVDWNDRDTRTPSVRFKDPSGGEHIVEFTPAGTPQILWDNRLRLYHLSDRVLPR